MVLVSLVNIYFAIPTIIMAILLYFLRHIYVTTSRNIKRVESISKSPIYAHSNATLNGLTTIRASKAEKAVIQNFNKFLDHNTSVSYFYQKIFEIIDLIILRHGSCFGLSRVHLRSGLTSSV